LTALQRAARAARGSRLYRPPSGSCQPPGRPPPRATRWWRSP